MTFFERGRGTFRLLGSTAGGRGLLKFVPGPGTRGQRQILVQVRLDGIPAPDRVVARFRVDGPRRVGRPARLELRRRGSVLVAAWGAARNAERYVVVLRLRSGVQRVVRVPGGTRRVRLAGIPATQAGSVMLRGVAGPAVLGPAARGSFVARRTPVSPFRPFAELRAKTPRR